jgi:hypothetical protein
MSLDFIKFAFIGGEVSEAYAGRSDLEKFDLSLLEAENWQVDYLGGLSNCPGTIFCEPLEFDSNEVKLFTFKFSGDPANTNVIVFGEDYIRFLQEGAYVLEASKTVTAITKANPAVVTSTAHGFVTGDLIQFPNTNGMTQLAGRTFKITVLTANTFSLQDLYGTNINSTAFSTFVSGGTAARVYTLTSPYADQDLDKLRAHQIRDVVRLTHEDYPIYNLRRFAQANWTLTEETLVKGVGQVGALTATPVTTGNYGVGYVVVAVSKTGEDGLPSDYKFVFNSADLDNNASGGTTLTWAPITGAYTYNVYRTRVTRTLTFKALSRSMQVGYIGQSNGAHFFDTGITPDFAKTPPVGNNPFAPAAIEFVTVTSAGSGYAPDDTVTVSDVGGGTGFVGYPVIANANADTGPIAGIIIVNGGKNYVTPVFTITTAAGTGAVLTATIRSNTGTYPALAGVYQQRQIYAAPANSPLTVYGSRPGQLSNFDISRVLVASDSFEHEVDSEDASPLLHMIPVRGGLLLMSKAAIWLMSGSQGNAITATDVQADVQSYNGASDVVPLKIDTDILYCNSAGRRVNAMAYADQYKLYSPTDISILASHLFENYPITRMAYASDPHRLIHAVREDGTLLLLTMIKEQEVYAWTRRVTQGQFLDVVGLEEGTDTSVYVVVKRKIGSRYVKYIEKIAPRLFTRIDECVFLDASLSLASQAGLGTLTFSAATGSGVTVTSSSAEFTVADVGKVIRYGEAKARVTGYTSTTVLTVTIIDDITETVHYSETPRPANPGGWAIDAEVTSVGGLYHLEGLTVTALADGNVVRNLVVTNGTVTFPVAASRVVVGIPYKSTARNMPLAAPPNVIENKVKNITHLAIQLRKSRGLKAGTALDALYSLKPRQHELFGEANKAKNGTHILAVEPIWDIDATSYIVQDEPLPATILGYIVESEVGDDNN